MHKVHQVQPWCSKFKQDPGKRRRGDAVRSGRGGSIWNHPGIMRKQNTDEREQIRERRWGGVGVRIG